MTATAPNQDRPKLAVVVSHPIQYYAPFYRAIAADGSVDIKVFYCTRVGLDPVMDPRMGVEIAWKVDLLGGYEHEFLPEAPGIKSARSLAVNNPSITGRLADFKPDVVLVHGYAHVTLMRAIVWCRRHGIPLMSISDRSLYGLTTSMRSAARKVVLPLILKQFTAFLVISDPVHRFYTTFGAKDEQVFRVPSMLDGGFWECRERREEERRRIRGELGLDGQLVVLYVGKFIPLKRVGDLVEAMELLKQRQPTKRPITLMLAGDGMLRKELEERAKARGIPAHFLGFVNMDKLPGYYCAADALAHPSENESFGMIAVEASVFGLPLVMSDRVGAVGPTSIARPGENTIVYRCADVPALADALERLANEPETCARMSAASLRLAEDHDGRESVQNTLAAIRYCLGRSGWLAGGRRFEVRKSA